MEFNDLVNFVNGAKAVIEVQNHTIHQQQEELNRLSKTASATPKAPSVDRQLLLKAASAVHTLKGSPSAISVETIADAWTDNPDTMTETIIKLASEQTESIVSGSHMVRTIKKTSSAEPQAEQESADDAFWASRANR